MGREEEGMKAKTAKYAYKVDDDYQILTVCCSRKYWTVHKSG